MESTEVLKFLLPQKIVSYFDIIRIEDDEILLSTQYKHYISGFEYWEPLHHAQEYVVFKKNMGEYLSMDETCLSQGEVYILLTNKAKKGKTGCLMTMIKGIHNEVVGKHFILLPRSLRMKVKEKWYDRMEKLNSLDPLS